MKERCHICERKKKEGVERCKACKSGPDEKRVVEMHAMHNVNFLATPLVNLILTDCRLLVFEDISMAGSQVGTQGGLVGFGVGKAADKIVEKTLGKNGSLKLDIPFASIVSVEEEEKPKGIQQIIGLSNGKKHKFTIGMSYTDESITAGEFIGMLRSAANL